MSDSESNIDKPLERNTSFQLQKTQSYEYFYSQDDVELTKGDTNSTKNDNNSSTSSTKSKSSSQSIKPNIVDVNGKSHLSETESPKKDLLTKRTYSQTSMQNDMTIQKTKDCNIDIDIICNESTIDKFINDYSSIIPLCHNELKQELNMTYDTMIPQLKKQKICHCTSGLCNNYYLDNTNQNIKATYEEKYRLMCDILKVVCKYQLWSKVSNAFSGYEDGSNFIGDVVNITYIPQSQKYIEYYEQENFCGKIIFIDAENDNMFLLANINGIDTVKSLERESCHYLGMARGYSFSIKKS